MDNKAAISALAALSHERRMSVFHLLIQSGNSGLNAGAIATALELPPSSLSFHLTHLEQSGLISSKRRKRQIIYSLVPKQFSDLIQFLIEKGASGDASFADGIIARVSRPN